MGNILSALILFIVRKRKPDNGNRKTVVPRSHGHQFEHSSFENIDGLNFPVCHVTIHVPHVSGHVSQGQKNGCIGFTSLPRAGFQ